MLSKHLKIQAVISLFMSTDPVREGYTEFTREFISDYQNLNKEVYNIFVEELNNILEIINPQLTDYEFFLEVKRMLGE